MRGTNRLGTCCAFAGRWAGAFSSCVRPGLARTVPQRTGARGLRELSGACATLRIVRRGGWTGRKNAARKVEKRRLVRAATVRERVFSEIRPLPYGRGSEGDIAWEDGPGFFLVQVQPWNRGDGRNVPNPKASNSLEPVAVGSSRPYKVALACNFCTKCKESRSQEVGFEPSHGFRDQVKVWEGCCAHLGSEGS